jgi:hypothetical protein
MSQGDLQGFFGQGFDPQTVKPADDYEVLATGKYPVSIDKASICKTKSNNGHYVKLELTILDGVYKGRKLFDNINIDNPNPQCVEIGMRSLSAITQAVGLSNLSDTAQLQGGACFASVKIDNTGQNAIRTYSIFNKQPVQTQLAATPQQYQRSAPQQQPQHVAPQQQPAQASAGKPPWER